jgi:tetratricopeptide (TPR) repeat protein
VSLRRVLAVAALIAALGAAPVRACDLVGSSPVLDLYLRAVQLRADGDNDGAAAVLEEARRLASDDPDLTLEVARTYAAARRYGAAAAAYAEVAQLAPARLDVALEQTRFHLEHAFRVRAAADAAERAARIASGDPEVINLLDRARTAAALAAEPEPSEMPTPLPTRPYNSDSFNSE